MQKSLYKKISSPMRYQEWFFKYRNLSKKWTKKKIRKELKKGIDKMFREQYNKTTKMKER